MPWKINRKRFSSDYIDAIYDYNHLPARLHVCPKTSLFASASNDGTVKLWDAQRLEKEGMVVKSSFSYQLQKGETTTRK